MLAVLTIATLALGAASAAFVVLLVWRRTTLAGQERGRSATEHRLRPFALALAAGDDDVAFPVLDRSEQAILAEALARVSRQVTGEARTRIADYFECSAALASELGALRTRRGWRRASAAFRLGDMGCAVAIPALLVALHDRDREVRSSAARSLGRLGADDAAVPLVESLVGATIARPIAFRALLDIGAAALPGLRQMARDADPDIRSTAIELLGWLGGAFDAALLVGALTDSSAEVRARAASALGRLAAADGAEALAGALDDRIYFVRLQAARALGQVGEVTAVPALLRQAREDRFEAARAAAAAVAMIDPDALLVAANEPGAGPHIHEAADLLCI